MDKTIGQLAFEAYTESSKKPFTWDEVQPKARAHWEAAAQAVADSDAIAMKIGEGNMAKMKLEKAEAELEEFRKAISKKDPAQASNTVHARPVRVIQ